VRNGFGTASDLSTPGSPPILPTIAQNRSQTITFSVTNVSFPATHVTFYGRGQALTRRCDKNREMEWRRMLAH